MALFAYLGLFAWNARTGYLDALAERSGLEVVSSILSPVNWVKDKATNYWNRYIYLVNVEQENTELRQQLSLAYLDIIKATEERAELHRLHQILSLDMAREHPALIAKVIAARFGMFSMRNAITIDKGFLQGAVVDTPIISASGTVVGKVNRTSPNAANVLLITDPSFSLSVLAQESRTPGVATGNPANPQTLILKYIPQTASIVEGETIVTSGLDGTFPKGIPVGVVSRIVQDSSTLFQIVEITPAVDQGYLEDVLLLLPPNTDIPLAQKFPSPVDANFLQRVYNTTLPPEAE